MFVWLFVCVPIARATYTHVFARTNVCKSGCWKYVESRASKGATTGIRMSREDNKPIDIRQICARVVRKGWSSPSHTASSQLKAPMEEKRNFQV